MKCFLEEIQHFGLTIHRHGRSRHFYSRVLQFPLIGETVNRGERCDRMYRLREAVNHVSWYQIGDGGMETFYLPRHPSASANVSDMRAPGWRYMAFLVDGIDDFGNRLATEGLDMTCTNTSAGRCIRVQDPDGIYILFFDSGREARAGAVSGLKEIGLVVADPEGYENFFDTIGLRKLEEDADFLLGLFGMEAPAPLYGNVRLVCLPGVSHPVPKRCFPATEASPAFSFSDVGIKHAAFYVKDIEAFHRWGLENGIYFLFEPARVSGGSRITYFLDPEGNTFEAMQVLPAARSAGRIAGKLRQMQMEAPAIVKRFFRGPDG